MALTKSIKEIIAEDTSGLLDKHESWERVCLRDVAAVLNGYPFESRLFDPANGMPLIRIRDVLTGQTDTFYRGAYEQQFVVAAGDLLIGMDGDFHCARWRSHPGLLNQRVCKITPYNELYNARLLELALPGFLSAINSATSSVTVKHLSSRTIEEIELPLPPASEQARIVEKLEELLSDLDVGVAELKAAQKKLTQYRKSLLKAAVEGALSTEWRKHNQPAEAGAQLLERILKERRARWQAKQLAKFKEQGKAAPKDWQDKYPEPVKPDTTNLPPLPEGWVWASLDSLIEEGPQNGVYLHGSLYGSGNPIRRIDDFQVGWVRERESLNLVKADAECLATYSLQPHDLIINRVNSVTHLGKSTVAGGALDGVLFESNMMRIRLSPLCAVSYVGQYLGSHIGRMRLIKNAKWAVNQASINQQDVRNTPVPLPPIAEQLLVFQWLQEALSGIDAQTQAILQSLSQSTAQRKNILKAAFSCQLVPQDPNDEPAIELLARIRAERAGLALVKTVKKRRPASVVDNFGLSHLNPEKT